MRQMIEAASGAPAPSVAIVIPTLNRAVTLGEAIDSALACAPARVVIVDCGSTDGSLELIRSYGDRVEPVVGSFPNAAAARNAGAARVREELIGFLDSDDVMLPGKVSVLGPMLDAGRDVVLGHGTLEVIDEAGRVDRDATSEQEAARKRGRGIGTSYAGLAAYCWMYTSATVIRRSVYEQVGGYDETLDVYEDWDLYLRMSLIGRLLYEEVPVARYRVWSGNVPWDRTAEGVVAVARKHLGMLGAVPQDQRRAAEAAFHRRLAGSLYTLVELREARREALAALRLGLRDAVASPEVRRALTRSFLPASILERWRATRSSP